MASSWAYLNPTFTQNGANVSAQVTNTQRSNVLSPDIYGSTGLDSLSFFGTATANTPANKNWASTEVSTVTDLITTATAHLLKTGLAVAVTTGGSLPTGLATSTTYYIYVVSATTFGFCATLADSQNAALINLTGAGAGTSTVVPTALAGASVALQGSFDGTNWVTIPNTTASISGTASFGPIEVDFIRYPNIAVYASVTSGMLSFSPLQIGYKGA